MDTCDPAIGCVNADIDVDGDGHPARMASCGTDCSDTNEDIYPGAEELCDGMDNDCDMMTDEVAPTWYIDCDNDGFAANTTGSRMGCTEPAAALAGCPTGTPGGWTSMRPMDAASTDCFDRNALARPNQSSYQTTPAAGRSSSVDFDYDCDGTEERRYGSDGSGFIIRCSGEDSRSCFGTSYWADGTVPACGAPAETLRLCSWNLLTRSCTLQDRSTVQSCL
jgi:hypothetical protein